MHGGACVLFLCCLIQTISPNGGDRLFGRLISSGDIHHLEQTTRTCWPLKKVLEMGVYDWGNWRENSPAPCFFWTSEKEAAWRDLRQESGKANGLTVSWDWLLAQPISERHRVESPCRKGLPEPSAPAQRLIYQICIITSLCGLKQKTIIDLWPNWERTSDITMQNPWQCPLQSQGFSQRAWGETKSPKAGPEAWSCDVIRAPALYMD